MAVTLFSLRPTRWGRQFLVFGGPMEVLCSPFQQNVSSQLPCCWKPFQGLATALVLLMASSGPWCEALWARLDLEQRCQLQEVDSNS